MTSSRAPVKSQKVLQKDLLEAVLEKSWSEKFYKNIYPKENIIKVLSSVISQPAKVSGSLQLYWKRTPSQFFSYVTEAIKVCLKYIIKMFKISIN